MYQPLLQLACKTKEKEQCEIIWETYQKIEKLLAIYQKLKSEIEIKI